MMRRQTVEIVLSLTGGVLLLVLAAYFFRRGDLTMALLTGAVGFASLVLARQDFARLRRP
jgi:uncharacterized membrane protein